MKAEKFNYRNVKKFDTWYCKDRRVLIYLGKSTNTGEYLWLWVDTLMAVESKWDYDLNIQTYMPLDENYVKCNLKDHIKYLFSKGNESILKYILLSYKGSPNVVSYIGNYKDSIVESIECRYTFPENIEPPVKKAELKEGYLYSKMCGRSKEIYLYLGRRTVSIYSGYNIKKGRRKVHLFMFCDSSILKDNFTSDNHEKLEETLKKELKFRMMTGYDGNFGINFKRQDLKEVGFGIHIDISSDAVWVLCRDGHIIHPNGNIIPIT